MPTCIFSEVSYLDIITMGLLSGTHMNDIWISLAQTMVIMFYINLVGTWVILLYPFLLSLEWIYENAPHVTRLIYITQQKLVSCE